MTSQDLANRLQAENETLRRAENPSRAGQAQVEQAVDIHEALHHRPHQQEY